MALQVAKIASSGLPRTNTINAGALQDFFARELRLATASEDASNGQASPAGKSVAPSAAHQGFIVIGALTVSYTHLTLPTKA